MGNAMTTAYRLRSWTEVVRPHPDVASGDLAMGTYAANLAAVAYGTHAGPSVYSDAREFFAATYFTQLAPRQGRPAGVAP
jgi:hypothetical protein